MPALFVYRVFRLLPMSDKNSFGKKARSFFKSAAGRQFNIFKRRLIRGAVLAVVAGATWFATQQGWIGGDTTTETTATVEQTAERQNSQTNNDARVNNFESAPSSSSVQTLRLDDPLLRGESHKVTNETKVVKTKQLNRNNDNKKIAELFQQKRSDTWVTAYGKVGKVLPDDLKGSRHQRFLMDIGQQKWLLIAHNIDLAPKVPLRQGDALIVYGEYEYNDKGGVIHWTHHDPRGYKDGGYIEHNNKRYE